MKMVKKMNSVSNRTLVYLLVVAIVVSLTGTLISLSKLGELSVTGFGAGNATGEINLSVITSCSVTMSGSDIDFGSGTVSSGGTCELNTSAGTNSGCSGFSTVSHGLNFTNNGNEDINLSIKGNTTATAFITGTGPEFKINANAIQAGVCGGGNFALGSWTELSTTAAILCNESNRLAPTEDNDTLEIDVYLKIPDDTGAAGGKVLITMIGLCTE
jgi:hypothetical protein